MKKCSLCQKKKPESDFNKNSARKDGLQSHCRQCGRKHASNYYSQNRTRMRGMITEKKKERMEENRKKLFDYLLQHPCVGCGEKDPVVLDADHVRGSKESNVSTMVCNGVSWERIERELQKCEIRCANCHRRKSARELGHRRHAFSQASGL